VVRKDLMVQQATTSYTRRPHRLMSLILIVVSHRAIDLLCLTETGMMMTALFSVAYRAPLTTSSIVRDHVQLMTCRSTTAASPLSPVPILRGRRSTLPIIRPRLRSSVHVAVSAVSLRSSSCCTGQARICCSSSRRSLTN